VKTESEIRKMRDNLVAAAKAPCKCTSLFAQIDCAVARQNMHTQAVILTWVLGESSEMDRAEEELAAWFAREKAK
jgi:hypothetical protein